MVFCPGGGDVVYQRKDIHQRTLTWAPFRLENPASGEVLDWEPLCRAHFTTDSDVGCEGGSGNDDDHHHGDEGVLDAAVSIEFATKYI